MAYQEKVEDKKVKDAGDDTMLFSFMADHAADPFILLREDGSFAYLNKIALEKVKTLFYEMPSTGWTGR